MKRQQRHIAGFLLSVSHSVTFSHFNEELGGLLSARPLQIQHALLTDVSDSPLVSVTEHV